jgi:GNAT superfamily N-acetyltransferase
MIDFRPAIATDTSQVLALLEEIMENHGVTPPAPERLRDTITKILASPSHQLLVADEAGRLVGMCALLFSQSTWSASLVCELQDVIVTDSYRRTDVGRGLLSAAEEIARARGCSRVQMLAESWNFAAHAFYRSLGLAEKTCLYFERDLLSPAGPDRLLGT